MCKVAAAVNSGTGRLTALQEESDQSDWFDDLVTVDAGPSLAGAALVSATLLLGAVLLLLSFIGLAAIGVNVIEALL